MHVRFGRGLSAKVTQYSMYIRKTVSANIDNTLVSATQDASSRVQLTAAGISQLHTIFSKICVIVFVSLTLVMKASESIYRQWAFKRSL